MLQQAIQALKPHELERRQAEQEEIVDETGDTEGTLISAGFSVGQEVVASQELQIKETTIAFLGSKAVVVAGDLVPGRVTVKFDERLDGKSQCVHVLPQEVVPQLPASCGVCVGERVVAAMDLFVGSTLIVWFGTQGVVECLTPQMQELRVTVQFTDRADGSSNRVNVTPAEITPYCMLAGGFWPMQRVQASSDLFAAGQKIVSAGMSGIICARFSETRFSVKFVAREDGSDAMVNVVPEEVRLQTRHGLVGSGQPWSCTKAVLLYGFSMACVLLLLRRRRK